MTNSKKISASESSAVSMYSHRLMSLTWNKMLREFKLNFYVLGENTGELVFWIDIVARQRNKESIENLFERLELIVRTGFAHSYYEDFSALWNQFLKDHEPVYKVPISTLRKWLRTLKHKADPDKAWRNALVDEIAEVLNGSEPEPRCEEWKSKNDQET